jgi:hypothetical protein
MSEIVRRGNQFGNLRAFFQERNPSHLSWRLTFPPFGPTVTRKKFHIACWRVCILYAMPITHPCLPPVVVLLHTCCSDPTVAMVLKMKRKDGSDVMRGGKPEREKKPKRKMKKKSESARDMHSTKLMRMADRRVPTRIHRQGVRYASASQMVRGAQTERSMQSDPIHLPSLPSWGSPSVPSPRSVVPSPRRNYRHAYDQMLEDLPDFHGSRATGATHAVTYRSGFLGGR